MKKTLLFLLVLFATSALSAQVLLQQDFSAGTMPPSGWMILGNTSNYSNSASTMAGGVAPEARLKNSPAFNGTMRFISPATSTSGMSKVILQFKHLFDHVDGNTTAFTLAVETRSSASGAWNIVWSKAATADIAAETVTILVNNADVGSPSFQFCLKVTGSTTVFKDWYFDDITLLNPLPTDAAMASIGVPVLFIGNKAVNGKFVNIGDAAISSAKVNWMKEGGDVHTTPFTGLNIITGGEYAFTCTDSLIGAPGVFDLTVWISNVNGASADDNPANDTMVKNLSVPEHLVFRRPMFEEFTSSTCGPCASFNSSTFNPFIAAHGDEVTLIKYQMNWPNAGDPYYTAEGGVRRGYYGVNAVPDLYVDGKTCGTSSTAVNNAFNNSKATMTYLEIDSKHEIQGNKVFIDCNIIPYANYNGITLQIGVIEKKTTGNVATNGETEFHNVMMKMVPDATGTPLNLTGNQVFNLTYTVDMTGTHVEQMTDLMVAIFVQENSTKTILNSNYSVETGSLLSITPANGSSNVSVTNALKANFHQAVRMPNGSAITNDNVASVITLKENNSLGANFPFTAEINAGKTIITITPTAPLKSLQQYYFNIGELENNLGIPTIPGMSVFTTEFSTIGFDDPKISAITIYPNPASEKIYVKSNNISAIKSIELVNSIGTVVRYISTPQTTLNEVSVKVSDLPTGIYFVRVISDSNIQTSRVVIK